MLRILKTVVLVLALTAVQVCVCEPPARAPVADNPLLTREGIAELSEIRVRDRSQPVKIRCANYERTLRELVTDEPLKGAAGTILFEAVFEVLKNRKLPFNNPQPVLSDLQECLAQKSEAPTEHPPAGEQVQPRRDVIAGPPRKESPAPQDDDRMKKILDEHETARKRTVDQGQDIYYKPNSQDENEFYYDRPKSSDANLDKRGLLNKIANELKEEADDDDNDDDDRSTDDEYNEADGGHQEGDGDNDDEVQPRYEQRNSEAGDNDADHELVENLTREKENLEESLKLKESELESLQLEVAGLKRVVATGKLEADSSSNRADLDRARFEEMKQLYESVSKREENMKRIIDEMNFNKHEKEDKKDDKKRVKDPADQAAILFEKLSAKDGPEDRCYKYYLLFTYPDKIVKKTVKTIAKLQLDLHDMTEFHSLVNSAFSLKLARVLDELASSKKVDVQHVAEEFGECFRDLSFEERTNPTDEIDIHDQNVFEIPVEILPSRKNAAGLSQGDSYQQIYPAGPGRIGRGGGGGSYSAASAEDYGGSNYAGDIPALYPMPQHNNYYYSRNPYIR